MKNTSWGKIYHWGEYQRDLILPNILRLLNVKKGEAILDLGCGAGLFAKEFLNAGARVIGVDVSKDLIAAAKITAKGGEFYIGSASCLSFLKDNSIDKITVILAIQNMENINGVFAECRRVLKNDGKLFLVMNHPAFRIPKASSWGWDDQEKKQYRRLDGYMSESEEKIRMRPGEAPAETTISFHRPLQVYFKSLSKNGFGVTKLEEWISNKKSEPGPRSKAEDVARKEFPLFLFLESFKY